MQGLNKVFLMGNLGNDLELRRTTNGRPYTRMSVATRRNFQREGGEKETSTVWHSIFVWGNLGETCVKYLKKGSPVLVEGYLNSFVTGEGDERKSSVTINAERVDFLPKTQENKNTTTFHST